MNYLLDASRARFRVFHPAAVVLFLILISGPLASEGFAENTAEPRWWKGNLHTHSLWSDGDSYPELVVEWYRDHGYHFLALTEHDILAKGTKWIHPTRNEFARGRGEATLARYRARFGDDWVETRVVDESLLAELDRIPEVSPELARFARRPPDAHLVPGEELVRLRRLDEIRGLFEEPGRFLLLPGVELSALTAHVNVINIDERFPLQRGEDAVASMQLNLDAVRGRRERSGRPMLAQINHPNFGWALSAERIAPVESARFMEIYNGHPLIEQYGDVSRAGVERLWDIVLTLRLAEHGLGPVFGLAVDDTHEVGPEGEREALPGRGWVMVRAPRLTSEALLSALEAGDFYATTGVELQDIAFDGEHYEVSIDAEPGVTYRTRFIGTRRGYDAGREPVRDEDGEIVETTWRYSSDLGTLLDEVAGPHAVYQLDGDELYVRAHIVSSRPKHNRAAPAEQWEVAWTQPVVTCRPGDRDPSADEQQERPAGDCLRNAGP